MGLTSAIQPSYLTSDYAMEHTKDISYVAPYAGMGLTSTIQPSDLTSDYAMGLHHGYLICGPLHRMVLTSAIQPSDLTSDYATGLAIYHGYPVCIALFTVMGLTSAIQPSDLTPDQVMGITRVIPSVEKWYWPRQSSRWPLTRRWDGSPRAWGRPIHCGSRRAGYQRRCSSCRGSDKMSTVRTSFWRS